MDSVAAGNFLQWAHPIAQLIVESTTFGCPEL
jgi:hypothetical protein